MTSFFVSRDGAIRSGIHKHWLTVTKLCMLRFFSACFSLFTSCVDYDLYRSDISTFVREFKSQSFKRVSFETDCWCKLHVASFKYVTSRWVCYPGCVRVQQCLVVYFLTLWKKGAKQIYKCFSCLPCLMASTKSIIKPRYALLILKAFTAS